MYLPLRAPFSNKIIRVSEMQIVSIGEHMADMQRFYGVSGVHVCMSFKGRNATLHAKVEMILNDP